MFVARGFADLGFEVFLFMPNGKLLSLLTGEQSKISSEDPHLFRVCFADDLHEELLDRGWNIDLLEFQNQRNWSLKLSKLNEHFETRADTLLEVLLSALTTIVSRN